MSLKFRKDFPAQVVNGWSVSQWMMIFSGKSLKNIFTEAEASPVTPVNVGLYMGVGPVWGVRAENL